MAVIDREKDFQIKKSAATIGRLLDLCEKQRQEIIENPLPHLERMERLVGTVVCGLRDIERVLSGASCLKADSLQYESIEAGLMRRMREAQEIIGDIKKKISEINKGDK